MFEAAEEHGANAEFVYLNTITGQWIWSGKARNSKRRNAENKKHALLGDRKDLESVFYTSFPEGRVQTLQRSSEKTSLLKTLLCMLALVLTEQTY